MDKKRLSFMEMLRERWEISNSLVCVGLDTDWEKIPEVVRAHRTPQAAMLTFNEKIIDATQDLVCAVKLQFAFYGAMEGGEDVLKQTIRYIHELYLDIPVILDVKRNDIGNTAEMYVREVFGKYGADAVTINPYLGREACQSFLDCKDKGIFVLCKTSNPGAGEFQDLPVTLDGKTRFLYKAVARNVAVTWNENGNCALVVGATCPNELEEVRGMVDNMTILVPGIGAQGGDVEATVKAGLDEEGAGLVINSSRGIIYASNEPDFVEAARAKTQVLRDKINNYR